MDLKIITPTRVVLEESDVEAVYAKAIDGEVGILPRHIPMVTPLGEGTLRYVKSGAKQSLTVENGLLHTDGESVVILTETAETL